MEMSKQCSSALQNGNDTRPNRMRGFGSASIGVSSEAERRGRQLDHESCAIRRIGQEVAEDGRFGIKR